MVACTCVLGQQTSVQNQEKVSIAFGVVDKSGKFVDDIKPDDVRVLENGAPQNVLKLERRRDLPLSLVVMLDVSASQERILPGAKRALGAFVGKTMRPGVDAAAVVTFTSATKVEQSLTGDVREVRDAISRARVVVPPGYMGRGVIVVGTPPKNQQPLPGATALWDSVHKVSTEVLTSGAGRRAVILITDGVDTGSRVKSDEAIKAAIRSGVAAYVVGVADKDFDEVDKDALRKLAERTGGRAFFPKRNEEMNSILTQIGEELLSQYIVTFERGAGKGGDQFRKIKIEVVNPELKKQNLQLAHPQGYFAGNAPTAVRDSQ